MVIDDPVGPPRPRHSTDMPSYFMARPVDRLAAHIFDELVILLPIFLLLSAPLKRMFYHGMLIENQREIMLAALGHLFVALSLFVTYHSVALALYGTTLGKRLFYLRVVDVHTRSRLSLEASVGRSIVNIASLLMFGLGFLSLFSNARRRSVADRWLETEVVSVKSTQMKPPHHQERMLSRFILGFACALFVISIFLGVYSILNRLDDNPDIAAWLNDRSTRCEAVDEALLEWPKSSGEKATRLHVAMALYAASLIDRSCLRSEVEIESNFAKSLDGEYYLAQSFVHSEEPELSDEYLRQVCQAKADTAACELSQMVASSEPDVWDNLEIKSASKKNFDVPTIVWAIRHFMRHGQPEAAFAWIERITPNKPLAFFLQTQKTKALWMTNRHSEALVAALDAIETLPSDMQIEMASWMCIQETSLNCSTERSHSCRWLLDQQVGSLDEQDPTYSVALLNAMECKKDGSVDYNDMIQGSVSSAFQQLVRAAQLEHDGNKEKSRKHLRSIMTDSNVNPVVRAEAYRRYIRGGANTELAEFRTEAVPPDIWREVLPVYQAELKTRRLGNVARKASVSNQSRQPASQEEEE